jgi:hypothetical protein
VEYPDGLRVHGVSDPPTQIPHWNREIPNFLTFIISFAAAYLHDDGAFLIFYPDGSSLRRDISGYFKNYNFKIKMSGPSSTAYTLQIWWIQTKM